MRLAGVRVADITVLVHDDIAGGIEGEQQSAGFPAAIEADEVTVAVVEVIIGAV